MLGSMMMILDHINVPSVDNGERFIVRDRIEAIESLLSGSEYQPLKAGGLSYIYARDGFEKCPQLLLISCHVDSLYKHYFVEDSGDELLGSFDNSICTALLVDSMLKGALPKEAIVAFTGDEEDELRGVDEVMGFLGGVGELEGKTAFGVVLDVTAEAYGEADFTVENLFCGGDGSTENSLVPGGEAAMEACLKELLGKNLVLIPDAVADESWEYDEWDLECLSLCLPTGPSDRLKNESTGIWMHSDDGIFVQKKSMLGYSRALSTLCDGLSKLTR